MRAMSKIAGKSLKKVKSCSKIDRLWLLFQKLMRAMSRIAWKRLKKMSCYSKIDRYLLFL